MKRLMRTRSLAALLALLCLAAPARAEPVALPDTRVAHLVSRGGIAYRLWLSVPPKLVERGKPAELVLLLDADYAFPVAHAVATHLRERRDLPDVLLVGIGYDGPPNYKLYRTRDYTPTHVATGGYGPEFQRLSGGGPAFLDFLTAELLPWLRARFPVPGKPVLVGHSYGGLFAAWAQLTHPELLGGAISVSPSLWYDERMLLTLEQGLPDAHRQAKGRLYAAVGALEANGDHDMVADLQLLRERLAGDRWPGLESRVEVLDDETHNSVFPRALTNGLRFLWPRGTFRVSDAPGTRPP